MGLSVFSIPMYIAISSGGKHWKEIQEMKYHSYQEHLLI